MTFLVTALELSTGYAVYSPKSTPAIFPSLERVFTGSTLTRTPALDLLIHYKGPTGLKKAGRTRVLAW